MDCGRGRSWDTRFKNQDRPPPYPPGVIGALSLPLPTDSFPPLESPSFLSPLTAPLPRLSPCISAVPAPGKTCPLGALLRQGSQTCSFTSLGPSFLRHLPTHTAPSEVLSPPNL